MWFWTAVYNLFAPVSVRNLQTRVESAIAIQLLVLALRSTSVPPTVPEILKPAAMARKAAAATIVTIDGVPGRSTDIAVMMTICAALVILSQKCQSLSCDLDAIVKVTRRSIRRAKNKNMLHGKKTWAAPYSHPCSPFHFLKILLFLSWMHTGRVISHVQIPSCLYAWPFRELGRERGRHFNFWAPFWALFALNSF